MSGPIRWPDVTALTPLTIYDVLKAEDLAARIRNLLNERRPYATLVEVWDRHGRPRTKVKS